MYRTGGVKGSGLITSNGFIGYFVDSRSKISIFRVTLVQVRPWVQMFKLPWYKLDHCRHCDASHVSVPKYSPVPCLKYRRRFTKVLTLPYRGFKIAGIMIQDRGFNDTPVCSRSPGRSNDPLEIATYDWSTVRRTISFQDSGGTK